MPPAYFQHREVERPEPLADRLVFRGEARVAAEEDRVPLRADGEGRPQGRVAVVQAAPREMLRRRGSHGEPGNPVRFPPVDHYNPRGPHAPGFEVRADA